MLIDGRSVYRPGLASVDWSDLPLALEDVERIEVFRGPNTVSYGANALMGVINIITRAPGESPGTRLKYTAGQRGIRDWYASQSIALEDSDFRLSLSGQEDDGFDRDHDSHALRDGRRLSRFNLNASHSLAPNQSLEWQLAAKEGSNQHPTPTARRFPRFPTTSTTPIRSPTTMPVRCAGMSTSTRATASIYKATHSTGSAGRNGTPARRPLPSARNWRSSGN